MTAVAPLRAGIGRGLIELRQAFTGMELVGQLLWPVATLVTVYFLRDVVIGGTASSLGTIILPGALGMFVALGMLLVVQQLAADREDGTLLRAKATPNGIRAYLVGKLVQISATILAYLAIILIPGAVLVDGLEISDPYSWITFAWVLVLGLVATQAIGVLLGSVIATPRGAGYLSLPILGLIAISGIFAPITALPDWLQWIAQVFPIYWLGLGMRASFLPDDAVVIEIGESWRQLETAAVLGAWAIVGLVLAPIVLRRMARRESGSRVADRREQAMRRVG
ncbi:ABC transporter permease [Agromyces sp. NPDC056965]|uniref:ABC transporter permease n=1 Tax=Agromyces sp. NPDC056965 TaxID=3345983 RepID=UPI003639301D